MNWEHLRSDEFPAAIERSKGVCVIPIGCTEKHGPHLPVGTDALHAKGLAEDAAAIEEVCIFPTCMWLGEEGVGHSLSDPLSCNKGGYISLSPTILLSLLEELCDEIARNGFRKILILNSHGGNTAFLSYFMRTMLYKKKNYAVLRTPAFVPEIAGPANMYRILQQRRDEFPYLTDADMAALEKIAQTGASDTSAGGGHGDWTETCLIYGYHPELVCDERMDAESGLSTHRADYLSDNGIFFSHAWYSNYPNAYAGYPPIGCSENLGNAMRKLCAERLAMIYKIVKNDEDCVHMVQGLPAL